MRFKRPLPKILLLLACATLFIQCNEPNAPIGSFTLNVTSADVSAGGTLGALFTNSVGCAGGDTSPAIAWSGNIPARTRSFAVTMTNLSASGYVHWMIYNIPVATNSVAQGALPTGAVFAINSNGTRNFTAPCPPTGVTELYQFTVWALSVSDLETQSEIDFTSTSGVYAALSRFSTLSSSFFASFTGP